MVSRGWIKPKHFACSSAMKGRMRWWGEKWIWTLHDPPLDFSFSSPSGLKHRSWERGWHEVLLEWTAVYAYLAWVVCLHTFWSIGVSVLSIRVQERSILLRFTRTTCFFIFWPSFRGPNFTFFCLGCSTSSYKKSGYDIKNILILIHFMVKLWSQWTSEHLHIGSRFLEI